MKKPLIFICLLNIMLVMVNAQSIGIKAGFSLAEGMYKLYVTKIPTSCIVGFPIGISGDMPISESFFLNSGFLFIKKGTKADISGAEEKVRIRYLEIPVNVVYKHDSVTWKLFAQAGPYVGIGLSARIKQEDNKEKVGFGPEADQYKRMDYGINIGFGIEVDPVQIGINYGFGFINISNFPSEVYKCQIK
ncbi:MAG: PorT family protein [Bacteroidales bacterium]|nr:PorT family protein [Bacteroidales bacterium]